MRTDVTGGAALLDASGLSLRAPGGRILIRDLSLSFGRERIALIGRNGAGKSTLLLALAGQSDPDGGRLVRRTAPRLVPQVLGERGVELHQLRARFGEAFEREAAATGLAATGNSGRFSPGELRKLHLITAKLEAPELLLLDEPTQDLDGTGERWLEEWVSGWTGGLLVVSHDRRLLRLFDRFFIIAESGCRAFAGSFTELERDLERERVEEQKKYLRKLHVLAEQEQRNDTINRRRKRKKNLGRLHEEARMPTSAQLHANKGYAQASQGKAAKIRNARITAARELVRAGRRALAVELPLALAMPELPADDGRDLIVLDGVAVTSGDRMLFAGLDLRLGRKERMGVMGPNGAGKTTLLSAMLGRRSIAAGTRSAELERIGSIDQGAAEWSSEDTLLLRLLDASRVPSPDALAEMLLSHKFPLALAERPLRSLSPGERARAAFICLMRRSPAVEMLVLDEPTDSLDLVGLRALAEGLRAWPGGLVIASHDRAFLADAGVDRILHLDGNGGARLEPATSMRCRRRVAEPAR